MDLALKQRLVGASVLVALGVIFIPMLLDGRDPEARREGRLEIPDPPDREFQSRLLPVDAGQNGKEAQTNGRDSSPLAQLEPVSREPTESADVAVVNVPQDNSAPIEPAMESATSNSEQQQAASNSSSGGTGDWIVQLGSFGSQANAERLVTTIREQGMSAEMDQVLANDRTLYRVRTERLANEDAAKLAAARIQSNVPTLKPVVRRLDTDQSQEQSPSEATQSPRLSGWMIQVGSFSQENNALALREKLRNAGYSAHVFDEDDGSIFKVRVGPELDRERANAVKAQLQENEGIDGLVVSHR